MWEVENVKSKKNVPLKVHDTNGNSRLERIFDIFWAFIGRDYENKFMKIIRKKIVKVTQFFSQHAESRGTMHDKIFYS